jgi:hypothetical protein
MPPAANLWHPCDGFPCTGHSISRTHLFVQKELKTCSASPNWLCLAHCQATGRTHEVSFVKRDARKKRRKTSLQPPVSCFQPVLSAATGSPLPQVRRNPGRRDRAVMDLMPFSKNRDERTTSPSINASRLSHHQSYQGRPPDQAKCHLSGPCSIFGSKLIFSG